MRPPRNKKSYHFETSMIMFVHPSGGKSKGDIFLVFKCKDGIERSTQIIPTLAAQVVDELSMTLGHVAIDPKTRSQLLGQSLDGNPEKNHKSAQYFGQEYNPEILECLGLIMVRANILENSLVELMSVLGNMPKKTAEAIFYSSRNMKARIDMLRALKLSHSYRQDLKQKQMNSVQRSLDLVSKVTRRRNKLVHGHWSFKGDRYTVKSIEPNATKGSQDIIVTQKSLVELAKAYHDAGAFVKTTAIGLRQAKA